MKHKISPEILLGPLKTSFSNEDGLFICTLEDPIYQTIVGEGKTEKEAKLNFYWHAFSNFRYAQMGAHASYYVGEFVIKEG